MNDTGNSILQESGYSNVKIDGFKTFASSKHIMKHAVSKTPSMTYFNTMEKVSLLFSIVKINTQIQIKMI